MHYILHCTHSGLVVRWRSVFWACSAADAGSKECNILYVGACAIKGTKVAGFVECVYWIRVDNRCGLVMADYGWTGVDLLNRGIRPVSVQVW